jgi:hypothetical protein
MLIQKSDIFWTDCHWTRQITKNTHLCPASFELGYGIDGRRIFFRFSGSVRKRCFFFSEGSKLVADPTKLAAGFLFGKMTANLRVNGAMSGFLHIPSWQSWHGVYSRTGTDLSKLWSFYTILTLFNSRILPWACEKLV